MLRYLHCAFCIFSLSLCLVSTVCFGLDDIYTFDADGQRNRYHSLVDELRCPKCQNQNLAGSNSQIAVDLRRELHRLLLAGKTDNEIKQFMVSRYGDFVLYNPRFTESTWFLWLFPGLLLLIGLVVLYRVVFHPMMVSSRRPAMAQSLSVAEKERLARMLQQGDDV